MADLLCFYGISTIGDRGLAIEFRGVCVLVPRDRVTGHDAEIRK